MAKKRLQAWSLLLIEWLITSFLKTTQLQREAFLKMFYYQQLSIAHLLPGKFLF